MLAASQSEGDPLAERLEQMKGEFLAPPPPRDP